MVSLMETRGTRGVERENCISLGFPKIARERSLCYAELAWLPEKEKKKKKAKEIAQLSLGFGENGSTCIY